MSDYKKYILCFAFRRVSKYAFWRWRINRIPIELRFLRDNGPAVFMWPIGKEPVPYVTHLSVNIAGPKPTEQRP